MNTRTIRFLCQVLAFSAFVVPAMAQTSGSPSGSGIQPIVFADNPDCGDIGLGFGFKVDQSPNGTFGLTSADGELTGGAPEDPANSVAISNSDGSSFDWASSLGVDAVIVKAGSDANVYLYDPESTGDTGLHGPINPNNGAPFGISHIEFCYDYEVTVTKTAVTSFTRTFEWDIRKSVGPAQWGLFDGDTGTSKYTVAVTRTGFTDSDWAVSGTITVANSTPFAATVLGVTDVVSPAIAVSIDCGDFPFELVPGGALECTYSAPLPDGSSRVNTASATTSGVVGGDEGTAAVTFGAPSVVVDATVHVADTNGDGWQFDDSGAVMYTRTFTCGNDQGEHPNVATIVETGQSSSASVRVDCYRLRVSKDANPSLTRTFDWTIAKSADQTQLLLASGQSFLVGYEVVVDAVSMDSDWAVSGEIRIDNPHPSRDASLADVRDAMSGGITAAVNCPSLAVPAGGALVCTYDAALPDGANRTNTATAVLRNFAFDPSGGAAPAGTTSFSGDAAVDFANAAVSLVDECIDVDDTNVGFLGTVCAAQAPASYIYSLFVGPFSEPDECGEQRVENVASFVTNDTGSTGEDSWTVIVDVACGSGCTLTPGYWKTHSQRGPAPYDATWALLGPAQEGTPFFLSGQTWHEMLWTAPQGNAYYILGHAYAAAVLNVFNGASTPSEVAQALDEATDLFEEYTPDEIGALKGGKKPRKTFLELAGLLDLYNNGSLGPGHCSE